MVGNDGCYFVKVLVSGAVFMFLPIIAPADNQKGFVNLMEPANRVQFGAQSNFEVIHPVGVSYRLSTVFSDRAPGGKMARKGFTVVGHAVTGIDGVLYVRTGPKEYLPMTDPSDRAAANPFIRNGTDRRLKYSKCSA